MDTSSMMLDRQQSELSLSYFGWRVLFGAAIGLAFSPGPVSLVFLASLAPVLAQKHGWSISEIMFSLTLLNLASVVAAPFAGRLIDRIGVRTLLFSSFGALILCLLAWGNWADTIPKFYAVSVIYGAATIGAQSLTFNTLLTGWFDKNRGLALGVASSGLGLGYTLLPLFIGYGFDRLGPTGAITFLCILIFAIPLLVNVAVARANPNRASFDHESSAGVESDTTSMNLSEAIKTRTFLLLGVAIFLVAVVATGIVPQFRTLGADLSYSAPSVSLVMSAFGFATMAGRLMVGWLFDRLFAPHVAAFFFTLAAFGYALAAWTVFGGLEWRLLLCGAILMGLGFGAESDLIGYLASRYFGLRHFGAIYGALLAIFIFGAAIGPFAYALMRDANGGYGPALVACTGASAAAALLLTALPRFPVWTNSK